MYDECRGVCVLLLCGFPSTVLLDVVFAEGRTYVSQSGKRDSTQRKMVSFVHTSTILRNIKWTVKWVAFVDDERDIASQHFHSKNRTE
jgi:hypothetical protein